jgi:hypothetical protein
VSAATALVATPPLRVTGELLDDARLDLDTDRPPQMWLRLHLRPPAEPGVPEGLPYRASVCLGADATVHMEAVGLMTQLRPGALVSVAARGLRLVTYHGHAALALVQPGAVVLLSPSPPPHLPLEAV